VTTASLQPLMDAAEKREGKVDLGGGPVLSRGANINPILYAHLLQTAKKQKIPVQIVADGRATPTDADPMQISRAGVAAALVSIPLRYMHTPGEIVMKISDTGKQMKLYVPGPPDFDPDDLKTVPDHGLGLYIIHYVMDEITYETSGNINTLTMRKTFYRS